jgi:hypothetical protein
VQTRLDMAPGVPFSACEFRELSVEVAGKNLALLPSFWHKSKIKGEGSGRGRPLHTG